MARSWSSDGRVEKECSGEDILGAQGLLWWRNLNFGYSNAGSYSLILSDVGGPPGATGNRSSDTSQGPQFFCDRRDRDCEPALLNILYERLPFVKAAPSH